jgi:hypothetical protein
MRLIYIVLLVSFCANAIKSETFYWIGGAGNWNDGQKWSKNFNGGPCSCVPDDFLGTVIIPDRAGTDEIVTVQDGMFGYGLRLSMAANVTINVGSSSAGAGELSFHEVFIGGTINVWDSLQIYYKNLYSSIDIAETGLLDIKIGGIVEIRESRDHGIVNRGSVITRGNNQSGAGKIRITGVSGSDIRNLEQGNITNNGIIEIYSESLIDDAIFNGASATFTNSQFGEIFLRDLSGVSARCIDNKGVFNNFGKIEIDDIQSPALVVGFSNSALFSNSGVIEIDTASDYAIIIDSLGRFKNTGDVFINRVARGIYNKALFENLPNSYVSIKELSINGSHAILNEGTLVNQSVILIEAIGNNSGLFNRGADASLANGGDINMMTLGNYGIINEDTAEVINNGKFDFQLVARTSIENKHHASFTNNNKIIIDGSTFASSPGLLNQAAAVFSNMMGSVFEIKNIKGAGSKGISNLGATMINEGSMVIDDIEADYGLSNSLALFANHGDLSITKSRGGGLINFGMGTQFNNAGMLAINNTLGTNARAIYNSSSASLTNSGKIQIQLCTGDGFENSATFINTDKAALEISMFPKNGFFNDVNGVATCSGRVDILGNQAGVNSNGIRNLGSFTSNDSLRISSVTGANSDGITTSGLFTTDGITLINNVGAVGTLVFSGGTFTNKGKLSILGTDEDAIRVNAGTFVNQSTGQIIVSQVSGGSGIVNEDQVENQGTIAIDQTSAHGIINATASAQFINGSAGTIQIGSGVAYNAVRVVDGNFDNGTCATMTIFKRLNIIDGTFTNQGFLLQQHTGSNLIDGVFTNSGVIGDRLGSFETFLGSFSNTGIYAGKIYGYHVVGVYSQGLLSGDISGFTPGSHYYFEPDFITSVGSYDANLNQWLPSTNGVSVIYNTIDNGCTIRTIGQELEHATLTFCDEIPQTEIIFNVNSGTWHDASNWQSRQVPTSCLDVSIRNDRDVIIEAGQIGRGNTLEVTLGASLSVDGLMDINPF